MKKEQTKTAVKPRAKRGDFRHNEPTVVNELIAKNQGLIYSAIKLVCHKFPQLSHDEMHSEGLLALWRAAKNFNTTLGWKFSTYAMRAILRSFMLAAVVRKRQINACTMTDLIALNAPFDVASGEEEPDPLLPMLPEAMKALMPRERQVIQMRFFEQPIPTLEDLGERFGVTKERIRQYIMSGIERMRTHLMDQGVMIPTGRLLRETSRVPGRRPQKAACPA